MEIRTIFDFDELNRIYASTQRSEYDMQKMLEASYMLGLHFAYESLMGREPDEDEIDDLLDLQLLNDTVWKETAGKNFAQRLQEYKAIEESNAENGQESDQERPKNGSTGPKTRSTANESSGQEPENGVSPEIRRLLETEYHRIFDTSCHDTAEAIEKATGKKVFKTWQTQKDDRVRDSHVYLQGQTVPLERDFYTYDNKHAKYPSGFNDPEEDINCRCYLSYSFDGSESNENTESH